MDKYIIDDFFFLYSGLICCLFTWLLRFLLMKMYKINIISNRIINSFSNTFPEGKLNIIFNLKKIILKRKTITSISKEISDVVLNERVDLVRNHGNHLKYYITLTVTYEHELDKIAEQMVKAIFFGFCSCFGGLVLRYEAIKDWVNTSELWTLTPLVKIPYTQQYYLMEFGWYCHRLLTGPFEYRRKDFWEMNFHHLITSTLIYISFVSGMVKVGRMIMFLHDPSDMLLAITKSLHYLKINIWPDIWFILFALSWFITRIILFPLIPIWSTFMEFSGPFAWCYSFIFCRILLLFLWGLNIYWFYLTIKVLKNRIIDSLLNDIRSAGESTEE